MHMHTQAHVLQVEPTEGCIVSASWLEISLLIAQGS